jgi:hypothetical protein
MPRPLPALRLPRCGRRLPVPPLAVANGRAEAAERGRDGERQRADDAEADARELRAHAAALQLQLAEAIAAAQAGEELRQADEARKARGLLARLSAAWRGR